MGKYTCTKKLRLMLDERGAAWVAIGESATEYTQEGTLYRAYEVCGGLQVAIVTPITPEQTIAATVGHSCASCPEMDNQDSYISHLHAEMDNQYSYISHLHAALKWHDEHVPRPTNPRSTCVVLEGEKPPEEVLFVGANGVTHYLPESTGTCDGSFHKSSDLSSGRVPLYYCKDTNRSIFVEREAKVCPLCGGRIKEEAE